MPDTHTVRAAPAPGTSSAGPRAGQRPFRVKLQGSVLVIICLPNRRQVRGKLHQLSTSGGVLHLESSLDEKITVPWERYHPGAGPNALSDVGDARMAAAFPLYRFVREQPDCAGNKSPIFSGSDRRGLSLALHPLRVNLHQAGNQLISRYPSGELSNCLPPRANSYVRNQRLPVQLHYDPTRAQS